MRQVFLIGNDISKYVIDIPAVSQSAGEYGQVAINDAPALTGLNTTGFWDTSNPVSPFYGAELGQFDLEIWIDGTRTYSGFVKSIQSDNAARTANVELRSALQAALDHGAIYVSSSPETPSDAVRNICTLYNIPIDSGSFGVSSGFYVADSVYVEVVRTRPEGSVLDLIQQLAEIGCMRIYTFNQVVYCDAYQANTASAVYTFSDSISNADGVTILTHPTSESIEKEPALGYRVETVFGPVTSGTESQQGKSISGGPDSPVRILSLQAGVFLGELWLTYLGRKQTRISFETQARYGKSLGVGYPVGLSYALRGWPTQTIDLTEINQTNRLTARLTGVTR